jgi:hypothetical protein
MHLLTRDSLLQHGYESEVVSIFGTLMFAVAEMER